MKNTDKALLKTFCLISACAILGPKAMAFIIGFFLVLFTLDFARRNKVEIAMPGGTQIMSSILPNQFTQIFDNRPKLMEEVKDLDCLFVWGGRGSGKTNFVQWLAASKIMAGEQLIIIDPKPALPDKWPAEARVIGHGHNYDEIEQISNYYLEEIETRKQIFPTLLEKTTIIVDELFLLNLKMDGFMKKILPALLEGREYNVHLTIISQSKTAKSIGMKGQYDLLECFDTIINTKRKGPKDNPKSYYALADFGEGYDTIYQTPGKFDPAHMKNGLTPQKSTTPGCTRVYTGVTPPATPHLHPRNTQATPPLHPKDGLDFPPESPSKMSFEERVRRVTLAWETLPERSICKVSKRVFGSKSGPNNKLVREILEG